MEENFYQFQRVNEDEYSEDNSINENSSFENELPKNIKSNHEDQEFLGESVATNYSNKQPNSLLSLSNSLNNLEHSQLKIPHSLDIHKEKEKENEIIYQQNEQIKMEYKNLLNCIIDKNGIINSVIISEDDNLINFIMLKTIYNNLEQNKKVCFIVSENKKAQNIFNLYNQKQNIKALILQKSKGKKNKNDYQSLINQINENNFIIFLPNVLYKLLSIGFIKIYDFGLIIFDDCHLCDSNHPYNMIMLEFYFYYFNNPDILKKLPKIIGFTNSPYKDKNIIKNNKKCVELLKNISENLNCQMVVDPAIFENKKNEEDNVEFIEVKSFMKEKNKIEGINIVLFKFFFEDMLNLCLEDYFKINGEKPELNSSNKKDIKRKYLNTLKDKFNSETFEKYNSIETSERSLHFLSTNSLMFQAFEDIQKHLINIIQNLDLEEIYNFFKKYKELYETNLKKQKDEDIYFKKLYKKMLFIFKVNERAFKRLLNKNVVYKTDRINKFINKLNNIYSNNKNAKTLIFVPNRKIANIIFNYLNRDNKDNYFKNKSQFIVGTNGKKDENILLTLATRITSHILNERIKEYNENKIQILICTPPAIEYLDKETCHYIIIFTELSNSNNDYERVKEKAKICKAKLIIFGDEQNKIDDSLKKKKDKEFIQLKSLFMENEKIKNPKDFRSPDFIKNKNLNKIMYYYIEKTEAKMSLKNCMLLFNEINNLYLSKGIIIQTNKIIIPYDKEQKFECQIYFKCENNYDISFQSKKYNDKQSAENECYMLYIMFLHKKKLIDDHFRLKI